MLSTPYRSSPRLLSHIVGSLYDPAVPDGLGGIAFVLFVRAFVYSSVYWIFCYMTITRQVGLFSPVFIIGGLMGRIFGELALWMDIDIQFKVRMAFC